jgi:alkanesulfonate monooxygenase SsuD/methylene tetrahydromethanopterin reductase-like flavin-dependent oxidoreductase (luciferase family)
VDVGTLVAFNSFRNPAILAKMATAVDEVSQGRFIMGIGAGWNEPEHQAFGLPFDHRVSRLAEALQILGPLLREGHVDFEGKYYQTTGCETLHIMFHCQAIHAAGHRRARRCSPYLSRHGTELTRTLRVAGRSRHEEFRADRFRGHSTHR